MGLFHFCSCILLLFILVNNVIISEALYFLVGSGPKKCFSIEQPKDTPVVFAYEILDEKRSVEFTLYYGITAREDVLIMRKTLANPVDHIDFAADSDGFYTFCIDGTKKEEVYPTRFRISINYGYDSEYYEKLAKEQKFDALNMEVHKLNDHMSLILNEADYQKHKEVAHHLQTERMNHAALWWPMLQIGILLVTGVFQVQHLKNFFKASKLI